MCSFSHGRHSCVPTVGPLGAAASYERGAPVGGLEIKDTHRPQGGPKLLGVGLMQGPRASHVLIFE